MPLDLIYLWMLVFTRACGLLMLLPLFAGQSVPVQVRLAVAGCLSWLVAGFLHNSVTVPTELLQFVVAAAHELLLGLLMGLAMRLIFYAIEFAGQVISTEMGLVMSSNIDPISHNNSTPVGVALFYLGTLLFFLSGSHHAAFGAFLRSFELAPAGVTETHREIAEVFVQSTSRIFVAAMQIAAPILAVNFVVTFAFALLGRAAPGINVFQESFSIRILAGLLLLGLSLALTAQIVLTFLRQSPELMLQLVP